MGVGAEFYLKTGAGMQVVQGVESFFQEALLGEGDQVIVARLFGLQFGENRTPHSQVGHQVLHHCFCAAVFLECSCA